MKNLSLLALLLLTVFGFGNTLDAHALSRVPQEAGALTRPVSLDNRGGRDGGEEDEEDLRVASAAEGLQALEQVDPGALGYMLRLRATLGRH